MTVQQLINELKKMPPDAEVGMQDDILSCEPITKVHPPYGERQFVEITIERGFHYEPIEYESESL